MNGQSSPNSAFSPYSTSYGSGEINRRQRHQEYTDESNDDEFGLLKGSYANNSLDIVFEASKRGNLTSTCDSTSGGIAFEYSNNKVQEPAKENSHSVSMANYSRMLDYKGSNSDVCEAIVWDESVRPRSYLYIVMQLCQVRKLQTNSNFLVFLLLIVLLFV